MLPRSRDVERKTARLINGRRFHLKTLYVSVWFQIEA